MKPNDSCEQPDEASKKVLGVLEYFAKDLDAGQFPGRAWPASRGVVSHRIAWTFAASVAGIAALIALALYHFSPTTSSPRRIATTSGVPTIIARVMTPAPKTPIGQDALPNIVIVEDVDSYSIIDMTGSVPLVSFARRDSDGFDDATPVFVEPVSEATTKNAPL